MHAIHYIMLKGFAWLPKSACSIRFISSFGAVDRAVREVPVLSRFNLTQSYEKPVYRQECIGTPRRAFQGGMIEGIRVKQVHNPYVEMTNAIKKRMDNWPSKNLDDWNPQKVFVRGSRRRYNVPEDLFPRRDELGEWHPPKLSGRYQADIRRQYVQHGIPWVWKKDFYEPKLHVRDREPLGKREWFFEEFRTARKAAAMRNMDELTAEYKKELHAKKFKPLAKNFHDYMGPELSSKFAAVALKKKN